MELCPHCKESLILGQSVIARVLNQPNLGPSLVATECCGKPIKLYPIKSYKVVISYTQCSFDDFGTPFNKEELTHECV